MTSLGPADQYAVLFDWASSRGVAHSLANLLIACGADIDAPANMCLDFLAQRRVCVILDDWKAEDVHADELAALSKALVASPKIRHEYAAHTAAMPLKKRFFGESQKWPILLCLGSRALGGTAADQLWFDQLRVWILLQGYRLAIAHGSSDELVKDVAFRLRRAADDAHRESIELIKMLRCSPPSVEALSRHLHWAPTREAPTTATYRTFVSALERLARGESNPTTKPTNDLLHELVIQLRQRTQPRRTAAEAAPDDVESESERVKTSALAPGITSVEMPEGASHTRGLLTGRGLQLRKVEALQFLPWSWETLTPPELAALKLLITEWEAQKEQHLHLLAFLTRVAIFTSRSLELVSAMRISDQPVQDWTVTPDLKILHRLPPRRSDGWQAVGRQFKWIRPLAQSLRIDSAESAAKLTGLASNAGTLNDLWHLLWPDESAGTLFGRLCEANVPLRRVSSNRLSGVLGTSVYATSRDGVLAQLLSSRPTTGLGGNAAYPSWPLASVKDALAALPGPGQVTGAAVDDNAAGSQLDPRDGWLRHSIRRATARVESLAADPDKWLEYHNAFVTYVVGALLCGTGGRPVVDPFESPLLFDWTEHRVFLCDKASAGDSGRLVPLPQPLLQLVEAYCEYLLSLSQLLRESVPNLAQEIERLGRREASAQLPFFFFLGLRPSLRWYSVSRASLTAQGLFIGRLPWNLARHRLSTRMRAAGVDAEIIDSILGHADQGVLTHGDESPRTWHADMEAALPVLESVYMSLEFSSSLMPSARVAPILVSADDELLHSRPFGTRARTLRRDQVRKEQTRSAVWRFKQTLRGRSPADVDSEEWDALALELLTVGGLRPHPYAAERYETLQMVLTGLSTRHRLKLRRIFTLDKPPASPFRPCAVGSERLLEQLQRWFEGKTSNPVPSQRGPRRLIALGVLDLLLVSRVTSMTLLDDLLQNKKPENRNFRIVVYETKTYLEYHPLLHEFPDAPVVRHRISQRCATWLSTAGGAYERDAGKLEVPADWKDTCPFIQARSGSTTVRALVGAIAEVVEQANFIERPGIIAAYAAGRLVTGALPHQHWMLHSSGATLPDTGDGGATGGGQESVHSARVLPSQVAVRPSTEPDGVAEPETARLLFKEMLLTLSDYRRERSGKGNAAPGHMAKSRKPIVHRRELATRLASHVARSEPVSSAIRCFAAWIISLAAGPTKYKISSVKRYFSALSHRFLEVGTDFDLVRADSDDVLDFYDELLEVNRDIDTMYVGARLQAFHAFVCKTYGVQRIDWGELDCGSVVPHGSPGWIGENQYLNALELLVPDAATSPRESIAAAFLLILSYRAGLRGADAIGLQARDWLMAKDDAGHLDIAISVRPNRLRGLKRPASRRIVPKLETPTELETSIIREFTATFDTLQRKDPNFPLFAKETSGERFALRALVDQVNDVLGKVHGYRVTMHMGRHSFASRVAKLLMADHLRPPDAALGDQHSSADVCRTLLGSARPTRRAPWALARALGHSRPSVAFKSYVHWIPFWCDEWNAKAIDALDGKDPTPELQGVTILDTASLVAWTPKKTTPAAPSATTPTLSSTGKYLEFVRHGCRRDSAARAAEISTEQAAHIDKAIREATDILKPRERRNREPLSSILSRVDGAEWRLIYDACIRNQDQATPATDKLPATIESGLTLLSENRQLVVWEEAHYRWLAEFIRLFSLPLDAFALRRPQATGEHVDHIRTARLESYAQDVPPGKIDSVVGPQHGRLDRCAFIIRGRRGTHTGTGLALMWAIYLSTFLLPS